MYVLKCIPTLEKIKILELSEQVPARCRKRVMIDGRIYPVMRVFEETNAIAIETRFDYSGCEVRFLAPDGSTFSGEQ